MASQIRASHPEHSLLAAAIALGPFREHRAYSIGFAIIWLSLHCIHSLWANRHLNSQRLSTVAPGIALGLLLIQSRKLLTYSDYEGPSRYLIIAFALLVGSSLSTTNWKSLLQWISAGALTLGCILYFAWSNGDFSTLEETNKYFFREGLGGINVLATVLSTLTVCGVYSLRISKNLTTRLIPFASIVTTYSLCLESNSRLAAVSPFAGLLLSWLISEGWQSTKKLKLPTKFAAVCLFLAVPLVGIWNIVIAPDLADGMESDALRLQIWKCSISNSILAGNNRIAYGNGFDSTAMQDACGQWQAHSSYVHFLSHHGLLGFISLLVILLIVFKGIRAHLNHRLEPRSLWQSSWGEVALGCTITVMLNGMTTTNYLGGYLNPLVIGLMLSAGLAPITDSEFNSESQQEKSRISSN